MDKPMHSEFARWYQSVDIGKDAELYQKRWEGLLETVTEINKDEVETLIRLAYQTRQQPTQDSTQTIRQHFRDHDETFEMSGNDRELQVLAGATLAVMMESPGIDEAERAALAITTTAMGNGRKTDLPMDLAALGEQAMETLGNNNRRRPSLAVSDKAPELAFESSIAKVTEIQNWEGVKEAFALAAVTTQKALGKLALRQKNALNNVAKFIEVQDEELQMLWWLTGQYSEDYNCAFNKVPSDAQPFVFASELAEATQVLPGPSSVKAILSRAVQRLRSKIRISDAVNALEPDWLERAIAESDPSPVSTPLHFAIKRQLETGAGDAWIAGWAAATGVGQNFTLPRITLSELFYRERLLMQFE